VSLGVFATWLSNSSCQARERAQAEAARKEEEVVAAEVRLVGVLLLVLSASQRS
jgi:hypothetical protein